MRIAHVRARHAPAGAPWRLAAALGVAPEPTAWLDLEVARRRAIHADPRLEHNETLFRQSITTLDALLALGLRVEVVHELLDGFEARETDDPAVLDGADLRFGPPILRPPSLRDFYGFERHVATVWARRGNSVPEAWYRLPVFYFSNVSELRGPDEPVVSGNVPGARLRAGGLCAGRHAGNRSAPERADEAIGGYTIFNDWSARDLQRDETTVRLGPAKGKDFASSIGPWLVTPDELADVRAEHGLRPGDDGDRQRDRDEPRDVEPRYSTTSVPNARARFGGRPSAAGLPGRSGTVGTGCLLEIKDETLGRGWNPATRSSWRWSGGQACGYRESRGPPARDGSAEMTVHTGSRRGLFDITAECERFVAGAGDGLLTVFVPHATTGVVMMELGAGSDDDLLAALERLLPHDERWRHRHGWAGHGADHVLPLSGAAVDLDLRPRRAAPFGTRQLIALLDTTSTTPRGRWC